MLKFTLFLLLGVTLVASQDNIFSFFQKEFEAWLEFLNFHSKKYTDPIMKAIRQNNFIQNFRDITEHNKLFEAGKVTWKKAVHKFADLTKDEFVKTHCGVIWNDNDEELVPFAKIADLPRSLPPETWDIREQGPGKLNEIKNQGDCSGCWAFATAAALENAHSIKTGNLLSLSEQQQIDCNKDSRGCIGGYIQRSFIYTQNGLTTDSNYPFIEAEGTCREGDFEKVVSNANFTQLPSDTATIQSYISSKGACTVCVDGTHWWDYYSGIFAGAGDNPRCNHAVIIVGYGPGYWLLRNSWGTDFGEKGYIKVSDDVSGGWPREINAQTEEDPAIVAWKKFLIENKIEYKNSELAKIKKDNFIKNFNEISEHNNRYESGETTWTKTFNKFSVLSKEEFFETYCASEWNSDKLLDGLFYELPRISNKSPESWDIRNQGPGKLNPIKDQGNCGSCWAFAISGAIENSFSAKNGTLYSLSEQQQIDCNTASIGCGGGALPESLIYTFQGLATEDDYPYMAEDGNCSDSMVDKVVKTTGLRVLPNDTNAIKAYIFKFGACLVGADASNWQFYDGGIFDGANNELRANHAVVIVGYGPGYWLLRNSWGDWWGDEGYIKVSDDAKGGMFKNMIYCPIFD